MSSATKTIELLGYFSTNLPEIGLTQFCKLAGRDKATTHRHLQALESTGFIEQNPKTKQYRLGPMVLQLARTRENTVPRKTGAIEVLTELAATTGETVHASILSGTTLFNLASCESTKHSLRAIVDIKTFPLHATASGICALAFGPNSLRDIATENMTPYTRNTAKTPQDLETAIDKARKSGFAYSNCSFEDEIFSISTPIFDETGLFAGAVSVACVASRLTDQLEQRIKQDLVTASQKISRNWGGILPETLIAAWAESVPQPSLLQSLEMDTAE